MKQIYCLLEEYLTNKNIENVKVEIRNNKDKKNGDFHTNLSFKLTKIINESPYNIGISIKDYIQPEIDKYYKVVVSDNGYINFYVTSNNYIHMLKEIQEMDLECNIKDKTITNSTNEIIYMYNRLENIINVLKLDNIYVDIEKLNVISLDKQLKEILDKTINIYDEIKYNKNKEILINKLDYISKLLSKYEENNIIRYLQKEELYNFIAIASSINILIKNILNDFKE